MRVDLPIMPPVSPMLAKPMKKIPPSMHYEGKWDGFRAIIFRDGNEVEIGSRSEKPLTRYFPEVVDLVLAGFPQRCVVDGEIVIARDGRLDFDALLQRIHPAQSRVQLLSQETPAEFVAFDLLALGDRDITGEPFDVRRRFLVESLSRAPAGVHVTPATRDIDVAARWFETFEGAGLDGIIAKDPAGIYEQNKRTMIKIKHDRTADCVVAGFRRHKSGPVIGSLLLGLYDDAGALHQVGVSASFTMAKREELVSYLAPYRMEPDELDRHPWIAELAADTHTRIPGGQSRWNSGKDLTWEPLRPELVAEVAYDHMQGTRFRHTARFRHWRPDRDPASCTYGQLEVPLRFSLSEIFDADPAG